MSTSDPRVSPALPDRRHPVRPGRAWAIVGLLVYLIGTPGVSPAALQRDTSTRTIYLVRHGQYDHADTADADVGKHLVPLGVAQARLTAARLLGLPVEFTSLTSSTMTRARETALVIGRDFPALTLVQSALLRECTPATWRADVMAELEPGEAEGCERQLESAFAEYFVPSPDVERHDVIVAHGNVIRYLVTRILGVDTRSWLVMTVGNCSITVVRIRPDGGMKLLAVGDVGHLPPNLQTGLGTDAGPLVVPVAPSNRR
jgi:serine/threonine-protein phosphatase PGAM5